jgi:hypothetical protein
MSKTINVSYRHSEIREIRKKEDERTITFVASDSTRDSAGTVLNQDNWDLTRFNSNGIIGYQHKVYGGWDDTDNPDNVIGKGHAYVEDGKLMVDITFEPKEINELAEKIYQKVLFGSLRAVSVGFLPIGKGRFGEGADAETYYFAGQQLLEVSVVNIPANPNALRKSMEAENDFLEAERKRLLEETKVEEPAPEPQEEEHDQRDLDLEMTLLQARAYLA